MLIMASMANPKAVIQPRMFHAETLREGPLPRTVVTVSVLCRTQNCVNRDERGETMGGR